MWSIFSQPHLQRLNSMQRAEAAQFAGEPPTPPPAASDTALTSARLPAVSAFTASGSGSGSGKGSAAADRGGPPLTSGGGSAHGLPRLQVRGASDLLPFVLLQHSRHVGMACKQGLGCQLLGF